MTPPALTLTLEPQGLTVCRLAAGDPEPAWAALSRGFLSVTRTPEELSIVCASSVVPAGIRQEPGWRAFKVPGPLDFGLTGVLAAILAPLAAARISIFAISTFDTDYVLVKDANVDQAVQALRSAGHAVVLRPPD